MSTRLVDDLRIGLRRLLRARGFAGFVILVLGLGMGSATALFSILDAVLLKPLPYREPERLVYVGWQWRAGSPVTALSGGKFEYLREHLDASAQFSTSRANPADVRQGAGEALPLKGREVTAHWLSVLGYPVVRGRDLHPSDMDAGAEAVALISSRLWRDWFGGEDAVLEHSIEINGRLHRIVGVLPDGYRFVDEPDTAEFLTPLRSDVLMDGSSHQYMGMARLAPGVSKGRLVSELSAASVHLAGLRPDLAGPEVGGGKFEATDFQHLHLGSNQVALWVVFGAVCLVLLMTFANVAGLFLTRIARRRAELSLERALGAPRLQLLRKPIAEAFLLSLCGSLLGLLVAWLSLRLLVAAAGFLPRLTEVALDPRAFGFMALLCCLGCGVFVLAAWLSMRSDDPGRVLRESGADGNAHVGARNWRAALVVVQGMLATVLLSSAVLLLGSLLALGAVDLGIDTQDVQVVSIERTPHRYRMAEERSTLVRAMSESASTLPGKPLVALSYGLPMQQGLNIPVSVVGRSDATEGNVEWRAVSAGYFRLLSIEVRQGRSFMDSDGAQAAPVAIVNESYARRHFQSASPVGATLRVGYIDAHPVWPGWEAMENARQIVGVVADIRDIRPSEAARPTVYVPIEQVPALLIERYLPMPSILIKGHGGMAEARELSARVRGLGPDLPQPLVRSLESQMGEVVSAHRAHAQLLAVYAGFALLLNALGLYGMLSDQVEMRRRELGVRMALGASPRRTVLVLLGSGVLYLALGLLMGGLMSGFVAGLMQHMLFEVDASSWGFRGLVVLVLLLSGLGAVCAPALRVVRLQPMLALRQG